MMFREMRRKKQALPANENIELLKKGTSGVLAVSGDDHYPYAVPLSYVYVDSKIYFHSASEGHKLDAIKKNEKVSFCVIGQDAIQPELYTTYFRSVIVFGKARILTDPAEKRNAIELLAEKYSPTYEEGRKKEIDHLFDKLVMVEIDIKHITGKESLALLKQREKQS